MKMIDEVLLMFTKLKKIVSKTNVDSTITASDYILLMTIKEYGTIDSESNLKSIDTTTLANTLEMSKPALTKETKRLEKLGLLKKTIKLKDLRNRYILLTPNGLKQLESDYDKIYKLPQLVVDKLGEEESKHFTDLFKKVNKIINEVYKKGINA